MKPSPEHIEPPRWADAFLAWYCRPELLEEIQGDVWELFYHRAEAKGRGHARRKFIWDVLRSFRLSTIKHLHLYGRPIMLKNHITIALRYMQRQKMFSAIKLGGFAIGVAACLLISLYIQAELSYDKHIAEGDRVYRIVGVFQMDKTLKGVHLAPPFADVVAKRFPEVAHTGRILTTSLFDKAGSNQIRPASSPENHYEENFAFIDPSMVEMMDFPMVYGTQASALSQPRSLLLSRRKAEKYFPGINPIGQTFILNDDEENPYVVGGVMENPTPFSHLDHDFYLTLVEREFWPGEQTYWGAQNYPTYVKLTADADPEALAEKMHSIVDDFMVPDWESGGNPNARQMAEAVHFELQPLADIHLYSQDIRDGMVHGDIRLVQLFMAIALVILLIACINFVNLSTAQSANRAREVGLRKVIGSAHYQLISQFLVESVVYSVLSFAVGVILANILLGPFNQIAGTSLSIPWGDPMLWVILLGSSLVIGLLAGLYPALYLSSFRPIQVLRGRLSRASRNAHLRNALVVVQFATSVVLIVSTAVIHRQVSYILNKQVGFDKEQVLLIEGTNTLAGQVDAFKESLSGLSAVQTVAAAEYLPVEGGKRNGNMFSAVGQDPSLERIPGQMWRVDHAYLPTMGMTLVAGRNFELGRASDSTQAAIINETMAKKLGLTEAVDKQITNGGETFFVIGVVKDFHFESLQDEIRPLCMSVSHQAQPEKVAVRLSATDMDAALLAIGDQWKQFAPYQPIRYTFLDTRFEEMYAAVTRTRSIFSSFALFAILVACLGLFALSAFMAEQRSKEISIRKVLGASTVELFRLMTLRFLALVGISLVIALPLAGYLMQDWLDGFVYSVPMGWEVFVIGGVSALAIALLTISYHALRTAVVNPSGYLRNE